MNSDNDRISSEKDEEYAFIAGMTVLQQSAVKCVNTCPAGALSIRSDFKNPAV